MRKPRSRSPRRPSFWTTKSRSQPYLLFAVGCLALAHPFRNSGLGKPALFALVGILAVLAGLELTGRRRIAKTPWPAALYALPLAGLAVLPFSKSPATSFVAAMTMISSIALATFVANRRSTEQIIRSVELTLLVLLVAGLAMYPTVGGLERWTGVFGHKNELGRAAGLILLFGFARWRASGARRAVPLLAIGILTLVLAKSATPVVSVVVAVAGVRLLSIGARGRTARGALVTAAAIGFGFGFQALALGSGPLQFVAELLGRRTDRNTIFVRESLWRWTIDEAMSKPWAGRGMGVPLTDGEFVRIFTGNGYTDWHVSQPHNGYIEAFFQLGVLGLITTGLGVFWTLKQGRGRLPLELGVYFLMLNFSYSLVISQGTMIRTIWYAIAFSTMSVAGATQPTEEGSAPSSGSPGATKRRKTLTRRSPTARAAGGAARVTPAHTAADLPAAR